MTELSIQVGRLLTRVRNVNAPGSLSRGRRLTSRTRRGTLGSPRRRAWRAWPVWNSVSGSGDPKITTVAVNITGVYALALQLCARPRNEQTPTAAHAQCFRSATPHSRILQLTARTVASLRVRPCTSPNDGHIFVCFPPTPSAFDGHRHIVET